MNPSIAPAISVVVPTFNRACMLRDLLVSLTSQTLSRSKFEIVVVDDGSTDDTREMVAEFSRNTDYFIRYFWQPNSLAGAARNHGIREARSRIVLFIDSDVVANEEHLQLHVDFHDRYPEREVAVIGRFTPGITGVDLRRDLLDGLEVGMTEKGDPMVHALRFTTADVSLKKEFLIDGGLFRPGLPLDEDIDLALRLRELGMKLVYCRDAIALHMTPLDSVEKIIAEGKRYGRVFADYYGRIPVYRDDAWWNLGARFSGGWRQLTQEPMKYFKNTLSRWTVNQCSVGPIAWVARRIPIGPPTSRLLRRLCKEIWAFYYRDEFRKRRTEMKLPRRVKAPFAVSAEQREHR